MRDQLTVLVLHEDPDVAGQLADEYARQYVSRARTDRERPQLAGTVVYNAYDAIYAFRTDTWDVVCLAGKYAQICINDMIWYKWSIGRIDYYGEYSEVDRLRAAGYDVRFCCPLTTDRRSASL